MALAEPPWVAVGATVAAVLLLTAREKLHGFARHIQTGEIVTAGKFLMLTGLVLPLLPDQPVTDLTDITPRQVWLAVLAVCTVSYASYLLQRYIAPAGAGLWVAVLGGLYSSTATTVVLARRAGAEPATLPQAQTGIILATAVMYLRLLVIIVVFNRPLALGLAPALARALGCWVRDRRVLVLDQRRTLREYASRHTAGQSVGARRGRDLRGLVRGDLAGLGLGTVPIRGDRHLCIGRDCRGIRH